MELSGLGSSSGQTLNLHAADTVSSKVSVISLLCVKLQSCADCHCHGHNRLLVGIVHTARLSAREGMGEFCCVVKIYSLCSQHWRGTKPLFDCPRHTCSLGA